MPGPSESPLVSVLVSRGPGQPHWPQEVVRADKGQKSKTPSFPVAVRWWSQVGVCSYRSRCPHGPLAHNAGHLLPMTSLAVPLEVGVESAQWAEKPRRFLACVST